MLAVRSDLGVKVEIGLSLKVVSGRLVMLLQGGIAIIDSKDTVLLVS